MNYQRIYNELILRAQTEYRVRKNGIYYEQHHIVPKWKNGSNDKDNLVLLTAREHFIAHKLLCKIHPKDDQAFFSVWRMMHPQTTYHVRDYIINSREYQYYREEYIKRISLRNSGNGNPMYGIKLVPWNKGKKTGPISEEIKRKIGLGNKNKIVSDETKRKISQSNKGKKISKETKEKISKALKGISKPCKEETKQKLRKPKKLLQCPHCNKIGGEPQMHQWHFQNCKKLCQN
jgi:hypothetical protein